MDYVGTVWNTPKIIRKSESKNRDEMKERERLNHKNILTDFFKLKNLDSLTKTRIRLGD